MYTLADKSQFQAHAIKQGEHKLATEDLEILDWISEQFGVRALNFFCENARVHLILDTVEDVKKMHANRAATAAIRERFVKFLKQEVIVTYRPLKELKNVVVNEMLADEKHEMFKTFEIVWTMSQNVIFYYTDNQVKESNANGTSIKIKEALDLLNRKFGFDQSPAYSFDSKEAFDRDYESKWHYYWK